MISIFSGRFTTGGRAVRPDPQVDHIMSMVQGDMSPQEIEERLATGKALPTDQEIETTGLVTLMVPSDGGPMGDMPLELTLNGKRYVLPRNVMATIPKELAALILHSANIQTTVPAVDARGRVVTRLDQDTMTVTGLSVEDQSRWRVQIEREE